jgi:hypothetical protein
MVAERSSGAVAQRGRSTLLDRVDAFIAHEQEFTREELREWYPELCELRRTLLVLFEETAYQTHTRPNRAIGQRLEGLRRLLARAELFSIFDQESGEETWYCLPKDDEEDD